MVSSSYLAYVCILVFYMQNIGHEFHIKVNSFTLDLFGRAGYV